MSFRSALRLPGAKRVLSSLVRHRTREKLAQISHHLSDRKKIIDIGCGNGYISHVLQAQGHEVTPVDIVDATYAGAIQPIIYDGHRLPFADQSFDAALLITVLHHIPDPIVTLREAARVAQRIIIIEELITNQLQAQTTYFVDSLFNFEFRGHPHTNKSDAEWQHAFSELGLSLTHREISRSAGVLTRVCYVLDHH